ncbi:MAG: TRAP transporter small permease [Pyramidobacter sp.]|nr:TRAP transporter small permease [Pyramidobacter sp.]
MAKKIAAAIDWLLGFNGCLMIAVATLQIVSRAVGRPVPWTVELLTFLGLFSVVPGVASHFLKGTETRVGIVVDYLPRALKNAVEFVINVLCVVFGGILLYGTWDYTELVGMSMTDQYLPFPPETNLIPVYILSLAIIYNGLWNLTKIVRGEPEEKHSPSEGGEL